MEFGTGTKPFKPVFKSVPVKTVMPRGKEKSSKDKKEVPAFTSTLVESSKVLRSVEDLGLVPMRCDDESSESDFESEEPASHEVFFSNINGKILVCFFLLAQVIGEIIIICNISPTNPI